MLNDFSAEAPIFSIQEMRENSQAHYNNNFNPIDKIMEQSTKIEELYKELLQSERDKIDILTKANKNVLELAEEVRKMKGKG